jgi:hypothetical protein
MIFKHNRCFFCLYIKKACYRKLLVLWLRIKNLAKRRMALHLDDFQCNQETYHIDIWLDSEGVDAPVYNCLQHVTIDNGATANLLLDFGSRDIKLMGDFIATGIPLNLTINTSGLVNLEKVNFVNFNEISLNNDDVKKVVVDSATNSNSDGNQSNIKIAASELELKGHNFFAGDLEFNGETLFNEGVTQFASLAVKASKMTMNSGTFLLSGEGESFFENGNFINFGDIKNDKGKIRLKIGNVEQSVIGKVSSNSGVDIINDENLFAPLTYQDFYLLHTITSLHTEFIGQDIYHILKGDFNNDGNADILHILNDNYVELWLAENEDGYRKYAITIANLASSSGRNIYSLLQKGAVAGDAELKVASFPHAWPGRGILQDINGDGYLDYAEAIAWQDGRLDLGVYLGDKHGNIADTAAFNLPGFLFKEIGNVVYQVGFFKDINNDGAVDYAQAAKGENGYENLDVYLGTGSGFAKAGKLPKHAFELTKDGVLVEGILQDLNGDGIADFSKGSHNNDLKIYLGKIDGSFEKDSCLSFPYEVFYKGHGGTHVQALLRDFNGDRIIDFAPSIAWHHHISSEKRTDIYIGTESGYQKAGRLPHGHKMIWVHSNYNWRIEGTLADFDGDGKLDYTSATNLPNHNILDLNVYLGKDNGHFSDDSAFIMPVYLSEVYGDWDNFHKRSGIALDINDDSKADIVKIIEEGGRKRLDIYLSTGSGFVKRELVALPNIANSSIDNCIHAILQAITPNIVKSEEGDLKVLLPSMLIRVDDKLSAYGWVNITASTGSIINRGSVLGYNIAAVSQTNLINEPEGSLTAVGLMQLTAIDGSFNNNGAINVDTQGEIKAQEVFLTKGLVAANSLTVTAEKSFDHIDGKVNILRGHYNITAPDIMITGHVESNAPLGFTADRIYLKENSNILVRNYFAAQGLSQEKA